MKNEITFQDFNTLTTRGKSRPHRKMPQKLRKTDKNVASYVIPKSTALTPDKKIASPTADQIISQATSLAESSKQHVGRTGW